MNGLYMVTISAFPLKV